MPYVDPAARARLSDSRERLAGLRKQRTNAKNHLDAVKQTMAATGKSGPDLINTTEFQRAESLTRDLQDVDLQISSVEQEERYLLGRITGVDGGSGRESFLQDPSTCEELRLLATSSGPVGDRVLGEYKSRDQMLAMFEDRQRQIGDHFRLDSMATAGDVVLPSDTSRTTFYGVVPSLRQPLTLWDLIPVQPMEVGAFDYLQEPAASTAAAETAELATKPSGSATFTEAVCKPATIAEWYRIGRQQLADVPAFGTAIENRLQYEVLLRGQNQFLNGDATGANIRGILHTSGIGAAASVTGDTVNADVVENASALVRASGGIANAVVVNPADVSKMLKLKTTQGAYVSGGPFGAVPTSMWGLPLIQSIGIAAGTALVGDFARGATIFLREGFNIRISDSDGTDFVQNALKLLGEMRAGLAVWQPALFASAALAFAA